MLLLLLVLCVGDVQQLVQSLKEVTADNFNVLAEDINKLQVTTHNITGDDQSHQLINSHVV